MSLCVWMEASSGKSWIDSFRRRVSGNIRTPQLSVTTTALTSSPRQPPDVLHFPSLCVTTHILVLIRIRVASISIASGRQSIEINTVTFADRCVMRPSFWLSEPFGVFYAPNLNLVVGLLGCFLCVWNPSSLFDLWRWSWPLRWIPLLHPRHVLFYCSVLLVGYCLSLTLIAGAEVGEGWSFTLNTVFCRFARGGILNSGFLKSRNPPKGRK